MTGSGKTGLCIALLEEAAIDGIPAIVIDPKGDLGESAADVSRISQPEISRRGSTRTTRGARACRRDEFAAQQAETVEEGPGGVGPGWRAHRSAASDAADFAIYTPGSNAGHAGVDLEVVRRAAGRRRRRRRAAARPRRDDRDEPAGPARHRRRPDQEPRAHPALDDPRRQRGGRDRISTSRR